jgi:hypothetical protein
MSMDVNWFHKGSVPCLLVSEAFEVEALLNQHAIELVPAYVSPVVAVGLLKEPM